MGPPAKTANHLPKPSGSHPRAADSQESCSHSSAETKFPGENPLNSISSSFFTPGCGIHTQSDQLPTHTSPKQISLPRNSPHIPHASQIKSQKPPPAHPNWIPCIWQHGWGEVTSPATPVLFRIEGAHRACFPEPRGHGGDQCEPVCHPITLPASFLSNNPPVLP